jgi:hypothetical protein
MKRQIEFLIKQINSKETNEDVDSDSEDGDEDDEVNNLTTQFYLITCIIK